jgi:DNA replication initiation complex subunit (GINS family)
MFTQQVPSESTENLVGTEKKILSHLVEPISKKVLLLPLIRSM